MSTNVSLQGGPSQDLSFSTGEVLSYLDVWCAPFSSMIRICLSIFYDSRFVFLDFVEQCCWKSS